MLKTSWVNHAAFFFTSGGGGGEGALLDMTNDENVQQKRFPFLACKFLGAFDNELF